MICPKCQKELADNAKFCKFCGSPIAQNVTQHISLETGKPLTQNVAKPAQNTVPKTGNSPKTEVNKNNKKSSKKKIIIAVIAVILALLIALGAIFIPKFIESKKISDAEKELTKILEESTTKPIVEMNCRDYDSDGTYEAYAIVGETDGEDEEHPEFYDADIYYVNLKKAQPIKENVSGKTNGYIELEEITYISIEVYIDGEDGGKSFIYTVEDNKPAESDVSGKYSNVHQEDGKVFGINENGEEVEVDITTDTNDIDTTDSDENNTTESSEAMFADCTTIASGWNHTVGLKKDGTVVAAGGDDYGQCDVEEWKDIIAISVGYFHTVGLKKDGTVVAVGSNNYGQCDVEDWKDIVAISAGYDHTVGLKKDGTVVTAGVNADGECDVEDWKDIVAISAGNIHTVGLKKDGTVVATAYSGDYLDYGQSDVSDWEDIVAISTGPYYTVGLKSDGTVVATGANYYGECDVSEWEDIVAISAGADHTIGLKKDGTVVAVGDNYAGQCHVEDWKDIVAISAGIALTVGLKSDGTVVAVGENHSGRCDVSSWSDIKLPE